MAQPPRQSHLKHLPLPFSNPNNQRRPASANPHVNTKPRSVGAPGRRRRPLAPARQNPWATAGSADHWGWTRAEACGIAPPPPRMPPSDRGPRGSRADRLCPPPGCSIGAPPAKTRSRPAGLLLSSVREGRRSMRWGVAEMASPSCRNGRRLST